MKLVQLLIPFLALTRGSRLHEEVEEFLKFENKYGKVYSSSEERQKRMDIFSKNLRDVIAHNLEDSRTYKKVINEFSDLTDEEFKSKHLGYKKWGSKGIPTAAANQRGANLPKSVNWNEKGAVTKPKNQGACGSCWAFATTEQIESYLKINNGTLLELSAQQITSCAPNPLHCGGMGGCEGAVVELALGYANLFGMMEDKDYPYVSGDTGSAGECHYDYEKAPVKLRGYEALPINDMDAVMRHLAFVGPLAVSVDASNFRSYGGGVFDGCSFTDNIDINHGVQLVGYGTDEKYGDYWLVRNSWGENFGENGYIRLKRHKDLKCGLDKTPVHGNICEGTGITEQKVCGTCGILFDTVYPIGVHM